MWKSSSDPFLSRARHGTKKNQSFGDMRIPGTLAQSVSLVPVCAMRVINGLPPANLICFIINPTKAVWPGLGCWSACEYRWRGQVTIPPMATIITVCTVSALSTGHVQPARHLRLCWDNIPLLLLCHYFQRVSRAQSTS